MNLPSILDLVKYLLSPAVMGAVIWFGFNKTLRLGEIKKDFEVIKKNVAELMSKSENIVTNITVIKTHLVDKAGVSAALFRTMSPITLTPSGKKLIQAIGFNKYVTENYQEILTTYFVDKHDTLLDLDTSSEVAVNGLFKQGQFPTYEMRLFSEAYPLKYSCELAPYT